MKKATKDVKALLYATVKLEGTKYTMMARPRTVRSERPITTSDEMWSTKYRGKLVEQTIKDQRAEYPECPRPITSCPQWNTPWTDLSTPSENIAPSSMNRYEDHSGRKVGPITNKGHSHYSQSKASFKEQPTLTKPKQ